MERRTFLLGLIGGIAAASGLAAAGASPVQALPLEPPSAPQSDVPEPTEAAEIRPEELDGVPVEEARYRRRRRGWPYRRWRRRAYRRYYWRPRRRSWRRRYYRPVRSYRRRNYW